MSAIRAVTFTRLLVPGDPGPLAIGPGTAGTFTVAGEGLFRPNVRQRKSYYPDADEVSGSMLRAVAKEQGSLPVDVLIQATTRAALTAAQQELEDALDQFVYQTTVNVDGVELTWTSDPGDIDWGAAKALDHALKQQVALTIPVYPIPA